MSYLFLGWLKIKSPGDEGKRFFVLKGLTLTWYKEIPSMHVDDVPIRGTMDLTKVKVSIGYKVDTKIILEHIEYSELVVDIHKGLMI